MQQAVSFLQPTSQNIFSSTNSITLSFITIRIVMVLEKAKTRNSVETFKKRFLRQAEL